MTKKKEIKLNFLGMFIPFDGRFLCTSKSRPLVIRDDNCPSPKSIEING
jgi:hypothetical protein